MNGLNGDFAELRICTTCALAAANGDWPDEDHPGPEPLSLIAAGHVHVDNDEASFSWSRCDTCGDRLGGNRHVAWGVGLRWTDDIDDEEADDA
jgi:hypothetical protein